MAMAQSTALAPDDVKVLESTRQKLFQLTNTLVSLQNDLMLGTPLPTWSTLQNQTDILGKNLTALTKQLSMNSDLLNRVVVFPSTTYPGRTQEGLLTQLLRKKLEPPVENWEEEGRNIQQSDATGGKDEDELYGWAAKWILERVEQYEADEADDIYTAEEMEMGTENVNTGLLKEHGVVDEDSDEDTEMKDSGITVTSAGRNSLGQVEYKMGEVKQEPTGKVRSVEDILRFATTGVMDYVPPGRR